MQNNLGTVTNSNVLVNKWSSSFLHLAHQKCHAIGAECSKQHRRKIRKPSVHFFQQRGHPAVLSQGRHGLGGQMGRRAWGIWVHCCTNAVHSTCSFCEEQEASHWKTTAFLSPKADIPDFYLFIHLERKTECLLCMAAAWAGQPAALSAVAGWGEGRLASVARVGCCSRAEALLCSSQAAALWDWLKH